MRPHGDLAHHLNIRAEDPDEVENVAAVERHMRELMRVPTIVAGAVMPDACPAGAAPGTIPVGGVVAAKDAIHPGMHSADICCSMAVTMFGDVDPTAMLDAGMQAQPFRRRRTARGAQLRAADAIMTAFEDNPFLQSASSAPRSSISPPRATATTSSIVGRVRSTGSVALVTHHGSRKPGAHALQGRHGGGGAHPPRALAADPGAQCLDPRRHPAKASDYWDALQTIRAWTKANHFVIHDLVAERLGARVADRFWNEHNFVFRKSDGLFYHAKGATPAFRGFAADDSGLTLIPLNMAEPILITRGRDAENGLGFAPHGAGRNFSRSAYMRRIAGRTEGEIVAEQTRGIDARFFCGIPDISELPLAYKSAATVRRQIEDYGLAEVVDEIEPIGCIMAGDWQRDAPWRRKKKARK